MEGQSDFDERMTQGYVTGYSEESLADALVDASNKAPRGQYRVLQIEINVDESIHDYKVLIGP
jgi:hypothetical protein